MSRGRVLVVDDEPDVRFMLRMYLESEEIDAEEASSGPAAFEALDEDVDGFDAVVLDHRMPLMTGLEFARILHERSSHPPVIMFSGYLSPEVDREATGLDLALVNKGDLPRLMEELDRVLPAYA